MNKIVRIGGSLAAISGLIQEGINARNADPFNLSIESSWVVILLAIILFILNVKKFATIDETFEFDQCNQVYSFFPSRDRAKHIYRLVKTKSSPPS